MIDSSVFIGEVKAMTPSLYRVGMGILGRQADVEDAVQQALMKAWAARHRVEESYLRPWLMRIVINECRNIQRQRRRTIPAEIPDQAQAPASDYSDIYEAMDALPEKMRLILLLRYMENYSEKDIAKALGLTVVAVKGRLFRAREALKKRLTVEGVAFE